MSDIEKRARELLAQAFGCDPEELLPGEVRAVRAVLAYQTALTPPEGFVLVPVEPTEAMLAIATGAEGLRRRLWGLMLAARPEVK